MIRVVLDTNVLVSAILLKGRLAQFLDLWKTGCILPIIAKQTFAEFKAVLNYPKFALAKQDIKAIIEDEILPFFEVVEVTEEIQNICRDPKDDIFLPVALSGEASWIVTGDKDLLELGRFKAVNIVTPHTFIQNINEKKTKNKV